MYAKCMQNIHLLNIYSQRILGPGSPSLHMGIKLPLAHDNQLAYGPGHNIKRPLFSWRERRMNRMSIAFSDFSWSPNTRAIIRETEVKYNHNFITAAENTSQWDFHQKESSSNYLFFGRNWSLHWPKATITSRLAFITSLINYIEQNTYYVGSVSHSQLQKLATRQIY